MIKNRIQLRIAFNNCIILYISHEKNKFVILWITGYPLFIEIFFLIFNLFF